MNLHTFKDVLSSKRASIINETEVEDDEETETKAFTEIIEGEIDESEEKFNDAGEVLEPFNLREERQRGQFDTQLNFTFEKEATEVDAWVADLDESTMEKAIGEAELALKRRRELERESQRRAEESRLRASFLELCLHLLCVLRPEETVARTMRRIKAEENGGQEKRKSNPVIDRLTDIADQLISHGVSGVYGMQYEAIEAMISLWEYRAADGSVQGPFTSAQIGEWRLQGYFVEDLAVPMRRVLNTDDKFLRYRESKATSHDDDDGRGGVLPALAGKRARPVGSKVMERSGAKRVRFDQPPSPRNDLVADLEDSDEESEGELPSRARESAESSERVSVEQVLELAATTASFDSSGRGPWVMSDEVIDYDAFIAASTSYGDQGDEQSESI